MKYIWFLLVIVSYVTLLFISISTAVIAIHEESFSGWLYMIAVVLLIINTTLSVKQQIDERK